jgi:iron complex transport system substrate-binding protein
VRIVSLAPSATEIVFALGLGDELVGVTHECDFPARAHDVPAVTRAVRDPGRASSHALHRLEEGSQAGWAIRALDQAALRTRGRLSWPRDCAVMRAGRRRARWPAGWATGSPC